MKRKEGNLYPSHVISTKTTRYGAFKSTTPLTLLWSVTCWMDTLVVLWFMFQHSTYQQIMHACVRKCMATHSRTKTMSLAENMSTFSRASLFHRRIPDLATLW